MKAQVILYSALAFLFDLAASIPYAVDLQRYSNAYQTRTPLETKFQLNVQRPYQNTGQRQYEKYNNPLQFHKQELPRINQEQYFSNLQHYVNKGPPQIKLVPQLQQVPPVSNERYINQQRVPNQFYAHNFQEPVLPNQNEEWRGASRQIVESPVQVIHPEVTIEERNPGYNHYPQQVPQFNMYPETGRNDVREILITTGEQYPSRPNQELNTNRVLAGSTSPHQESYVQQVPPRNTYTNLVPVETIPHLNSIPEKLIEQQFAPAIPSAPPKNIQSRGDALKRVTDHYVQTEPETHQVPVVPPPPGPIEFGIPRSANDKHIAQAGNPVEQIPASHPHPEPQPNVEQFYTSSRIQNVLSANKHKKRYLVIHPNGTIEHVDKLETIAKQHPNYVLVNAGDFAPNSAKNITPQPEPVPSKPVQAVNARPVPGNNKPAPPLTYEAPNYELDVIRPYTPTKAPQAVSSTTPSPLPSTPVPVVPVTSPSSIAPNTTAAPVITGPQAFVSAPGTSAFAYVPPALVNAPGAQVPTTTPNLPVTTNSSATWPISREPVPTQPPAQTTSPVPQKPTTTSPPLVQSTTPVSTLQNTTYTPLVQTTTPLNQAPTTPSPSLVTTTTPSPQASSTTPVPQGSNTTAPLVQTTTPSYQVKNTTASCQVPTTTASSQVPTTTPPSQVPTSATPSYQVKNTTAASQVPTTTASSQVPTTTPPSQVPTSTPPSDVHIPTTTPPSQGPTTTELSHVTTTTISSQVSTTKASSQAQTTPPSQVSTTTTPSQEPTTTAAPQEQTTTPVPAQPTTTTVPESSTALAPTPKNIQQSKKEFDKEVLPVFNETDAVQNNPNTPTLLHSATDSPASAGSTDSVPQTTPSGIPEGVTSTPQPPSDTTVTIVEIEDEQVDEEGNPIGPPKAPLVIPILYDPVDEQNIDEYILGEASLNFEPSPKEKVPDLGGSNVVASVPQAPVVWFRTSDPNFWKKLTLKETGFDVVYFFQVHNQPKVMHDTKTTVFSNGTILEEYTETYYEFEGAEPKITKTSKYINPEHH